MIDVNNFAQWVPPSALAVATFFLIRFVTRHDKFKDDVHRKLDAHGSQSKQEVEKLSKLVSDMRGVVTNIHEESVSIRQSNLDFQTRISQELVQIRREALEIERTLERTNEKADSLENKFDTTTEKIQELYLHIVKVQEIIENQQREIIAGAQALNQQNLEMGSIKASVQKISDRLTLVASRRKNPQ